MGGSVSYSRHYEEPTRQLEKELVRIVEKTRVVAVPFVTTGNSKLTSTDEGRQIWLNLCTFVNELTNKVWVHKKHESQDASYQITDRAFCLPEGDVEALIHDMCHWTVASPEQREKLNLNLSPPYADKNKEWLVGQEELAWTLEAWVFSAVIGEPELVDLVSPNAAIEVFHYWVRVFDPIDTMQQALTSAKQVGLKVTLLRRLLASWVQWVRENPASDARPRGCLGWGTIGLPLPLVGEVVEQPSHSGYDVIPQLTKVIKDGGVGFAKKKPS